MSVLNQFLLQPLNSRVLLQHTIKQNMPCSKLQLKKNSDEHFSWVFKQFFKHSNCSLFYIGLSNTDCSFFEQAVVCCFFFFCYTNGKVNLFQKNRIRNLLLTEKYLNSVRRFDPPRFLVHSPSEFPFFKGKYIYLTQVLMGIILFFWSISLFGW